MRPRWTTAICTSLFAYIIAGCAAPVPYLPGAVPVPYLPSDGIKKVEVDVEQLIDSKATKAEVIALLGRPLKYRADSMSYKACRESADIAIITFPFIDDSFFISDIFYEGDRAYVCVEVLLNFDQYNILIGYDENPWSGRIDAEKENRILLSLANKGDALAKQLLEKIGQCDLVKALESTDNQLETIAAQGNAEAQIRLYCINTGDKNVFILLCRAADQGNTVARYRLGLLHETGSVVFQKSPTVAYMWYWLSAQTGNYMRASDQAKRIYANMTPEQKQQSDELIQKWEPGQCECELATHSSGF